MKIELINYTYLKKVKLHSLVIRFIDEDKLKVGDTFSSVDDSAIKFVVKSIAIGSYNFNNDTFTIEINPPPMTLKKYENKIFIKS